ncbi:hypothetical protein D8I24_2662 (plasmid) [Cupriavidus necator H850]|nr:hypothetical protein D8I24_2662 [Cupriavidus necator H850]
MIGIRDSGRRLRFHAARLDQFGDGFAVGLAQPLVLVTRQAFLQEAENRDSRAGASKAIC